MSRRKTGKGSSVHPVLRGMGMVFGSVFRIIGAFVKTLLALGVFGALCAAVIFYLKVLPVYREYRADVDGIVEASDLNTFRLQETIFIYDSTGKVIAKLNGDEDSSYLDYNEIPRYAIDAFVAIEDRTFWENPGLDMKGIGRVLVDFLRSDGEEVHGASTITQQLARNRFLTREVSLERKAKEMLIAIDLTEKYSKEQIMEFYINDINFANAFYGLQAAARGYFNSDARDLSLSQIAYLCAIPNSPTYYNPYNHPEHAISRRDKILGDMLELGYITKEEKDEAVKETITVRRNRVPIHNYETTYAIDCAIRFLMRRDGFEFKYGFRSNDEYKTYSRHYDEVYEQERNVLYTSGYNLYTSLDPEKQASLQAALDEVLSFDSATADNGIYSLQGAATVLDNETGLVVAISGGRTQETDTYTLNRAFQSFRQPGSTIKPLVVYTPALENGYRSTTAIPNISIDAAKEKDAVVRKMGGDLLPLRRAVELSRNGVAWAVYADLTPELGMSYLTQMRFDNIVPDDYYQAQALGGFTHGVTTEEMAGAYSCLANGGMYREPTCIVRMLDNEGNDIFEPYPSYQVYQTESAQMMVDVMKGVIHSGTASSMGWSGNIQAAGKTGTTNNSKDGWFCGVTPYYAISVWVGYDRPKQLSNLYGATYPASIWKKAMTAMIEGKSEASFISPSSDNGTGSGTYLPARNEEEEISSGYTVQMFRQDHVLADQAFRAIYDSGEWSSRQSAKDLASRVQSPNMQQRILDILRHGRPGEYEPAPDPVPAAPAEPQPGVVDPGPLGPASDPGLGPGAVREAPGGGPVSPGVIEVLPGGP